ncbi:MAG: thiamine-phosphate synthase family protein, partial [Methanoregula sp.]|nr:thiamine-phosphate synthase family protein [Methanoregula sp.]
MIALEEIEACREFVALIPEVRTNMVFAQPHAKTP